MGKFKFDAGKAMQIHQALESLKNETLKNMAAEYIVGGRSASEDCPSGQSSWSKSAFSKSGCGCKEEN